MFVARTLSTGALDPSFGSVASAPVHSGGGQRASRKVLVAPDLTAIE
jgi:hypothetical protein